MSDMAYSMEYRGLLALERLVDAIDAFGKMGAVNNVYACQELHEASSAVRELFGLDRPRPMFFDGNSDMVTMNSVFRDRSNYGNHGTVENFDRALAPDEVKELTDTPPDFVQEDGLAIYTTP